MDPHYYLEMTARVKEYRAISDPKLKAKVRGQSIVCLWILVLVYLLLYGALKVRQDSTSSSSDPSRTTSRTMMTTSGGAHRIHIVQ